MYFCINPEIARDGFQVFALDESTGEGLMKFDGHLHRMKRLSEEKVQQNNRGWSVRDKFNQVWSDGTVQVQVECEVTDIDEYSYGFKGNMTVTRNGERRSFWLWGASTPIRKIVH